MPGMSGMSFGGGFARGLATMLGQKRSERLAKEERQIGNVWKSMQFLLDSGQVQDVADLQPVVDTLTQLGAFGPVQKGKKGQPGGPEHVTNILGQILQQPTNAARPQWTEQRPASSTGSWEGMLAPGNVDLRAQPEVKNPNGSTSTVDSSSYNIGGREVLLPSVTPDGRHLQSPDEIVAEYEKTGRHLGQFQSPAAATSYAKQLHDDYEAGAYRGPAPLESRPLAMPAAPPPERRNLMGVPLMSRNEVLQRKIGEEGTITEERINLARNRILPALRQADPSATLDDALAVIGVRTPSAGLYAPSFQKVDGMLNGKPFAGAFNARTGQYVDPNTRQPLVGFIPTQSGSGYRFGVDREALAMKMFGSRFGELTQDQAARVMAAELQLVNDKSQERVEGAGAGKMNVPADFSTARESNVPVGMTPAQVVGQAVPSADEEGRRRSLESAKTEVSRIKDLISGVLPRKGELGADIVPGAVIAARRRMPSYREKFAQLDAALANIVNALARSVGEQRGTQTEKDAERAYQAVLEIQGNLTNPTRGDTVESAVARIDETLQYLDVIMGGLPAAPSVQPAAGKGAAPIAPMSSHGPSAPTGGLQGWTMKDGKLLFNGKPID